MQSESVTDAAIHDIHRIQWRHGERFLMDLLGVGLPTGTHHMTWTLTDRANSAIVATTTQVILISDTKAPEFTPAPASAVTVEATAPMTKITAALAGITAVDGASQVVTLKPSVEEIGVGKTEPVLWTARDEVGNTSRVRQEITVQDTTPPTIEPADPRAKTLQTSGTHLDITAEMAGIVGKDAGTPMPDVRASPSRLGIGSHTVTWTAHDGVELASRPVTQSITVVPQFALTSSSVSGNGINLVFSQDVDPGTASGIAAAMDVPLIGPVIAQLGISASGNTVRLVPEGGFHIDSSGTQICINYGPPNTRWVNFKCHDLGHQPLITLPSSLSSVHGFALYDGSQPSFEACRAQISDPASAVAGCHTPVLRPSQPG